MPTCYGAKDVAFFLLGGRDILSAQTKVEDDTEAPVDVTTPLGSTWPTAQFTGARTAALSQAGFFDHATDAANAAICDLEGTSQMLCLGNQGNVLGRQMLAASGAFAGKYTRLLQSAKLHLANAVYRLSGDVERPYILQPWATITSAGNTEATSLDNSASSANGGAGYLVVTALTLGGYTDLTVKVRHSADNATFADLLTFTAVTAAKTSERKTVTGTVNRYLATSRAWTGSGTGQSATLLVGFARS